MEVKKGIQQKRQCLLYRKAKLLAVSRTSTVLSGFSMIAMVEMSIDGHQDSDASGPLLILYSVVTCLLVGIHLLALMISRCILIQLDGAFIFRHYHSANLDLFIDIAWILSTGIGLFLFLFEISLVCWLKFFFINKYLAIIATIVMLPLVILFWTFSSNVYRHLVEFKVEQHQHTLEQIESDYLDRRIPLVNDRFALDQLKTDGNRRMTAEKVDTIKEKGNKYFLQKKYNDAIHCYSQALKQNGEKAIYYVNRALCYMTLKQWDKVYLDVRRCLELDPNYIKAHAYLGQYYFEQQQYDEAIVSLKQALDLSKIQNKSFGDEIQRLLRYAQRCRFSVLERKRLETDVSLQTYLRALIDADRERRTQAAIEQYLQEKHLPLSTLNLAKLEQDQTSNSDPQQSLSTNTSPCSPDDILPSIDPVLEQILREINRTSEQSLKEINHLFNEVDVRRKKREIPESLTCKLCYDLMREPVITPFGITYCRSCIEENLFKVGHLDPIANKPLVTEQLVNNLVLKEIIEKFIKDNEWVNSECF